MSDKLEDFIREQQESFDRDRPPLGHRNRFEQKLQGKQAAEENESTRSSARQGLMKIAYTAAAAVVIFGAVFVYQNYSLVPVEEKIVGDQNMYLEEVSSEMAQVEDYYRRTILAKKEEVQQMPGAEDYILQSYFTELDELEEAYEELAKALARNYSDERVINAMIENYRDRIDVLEALTNQLQTLNEQKNYGNENA
ncbi:hypothetical protein HZ996_12465 [Cryomorphaceae bacterium]|nr:hypothetical protein HZ996_12465 [Cryomorphaceae bacterium]